MRHLRIYRAIRLIRREGSIRKASELLAISPSALNRSIQGFEEELGAAIFDRVPGGVRLTAAGELLLDLVERHLVEFDDMTGLLGDLRDGQAGTLRLGVGTDIGAGAVMAALSRFEAANPGLSVEIRADDGIGALRRHEVDLAVQVNPVTDDAVEVLHAQPVPLAAWARSGEARGLWELVGDRLVLPPPETGTRIAIAHLLRRHRLEPRVTTTATADQLWARMAAGAPACLFAAPVFAAGAPPRGLVRLPFDLGTVQIAVLRAARVPVTRPAQAFLTLLQRVLDETETPA